MTATASTTVVADLPLCASSVPCGGPTSPPPHLDERDPDYVQRPCRACGCSTSLSFRGEVRGLGNVPEEWSGAAGRQPLQRQPDAGRDRLTLAFQHVFRGRAPVPQLARKLVVRRPLLAFLRKYGTVKARPRTRAGR